ncbi:MAG: hypothetical protein H0V26_08555 [Solirubrobacterales bacterium]|nr:hypothetical protein [Solirubrobacterales bacterium]
MRTTLISLLICSALAGLAACGDDSSEQLSAEELVSRADEICRGGIGRFDEIQPRPPSNAAEAEAQTAALLEVASDELNDLRELRPPDELREPYDAYLASRGRALDQLERGREAAANRDTDAYAAAQTRVTADQASRIKLARAVGLQDCSEAPDTPEAG